LTPKEGRKVPGRTVRYSEAFKQQVVEEIVRGRYSSACEAAEAYGITGNGTVERWLRQSGRGALLRKVVRVEKPGEPGEIRRLKERVRRLEEALADAHMDSALGQSFFEILCEQSGIDPEEFKKKHAGKVSTGRVGSSRGGRK
jgi:transposase-like protein